MKAETLGAKIAALRKEKGMTQLELAHQLGITDKAVSKWERDLSCPDVGSLPKLAQILGVTVDELMQNKPAATNDKRKRLMELAETIFKALALAVGVGIVVLAGWKQIDVYEGFSMLGIGLISLAILQFVKKDKE